MRDLVHDLMFARTVAEKRNLWIVVVVPDDLLPAALSTLGMVVPADTFSGRTAVLDGGRLSLVGGSSPVFLTEPFEVMFLGWGEGTPNTGMATWRAAAQNEVRRTL